ncbi:unnamed protein product [Polarella glacialis]|uniref:C3H1-type domain-containing protein n=1 Tax=Polarella glacialis TaxID=89957 RepID=A0A813IRS4_POLGL|nr:unnamed protein product [Polarella glacialis]
MAFGKPFFASAEGHDADLSSLRFVPSIAHIPHTRLNAAASGWRLSPEEILPPSTLSEALLSGETSKDLAHRLGTCRPCSYYVFKTDGCRNGSGCQFCHLCTFEDVTRHRKDRKRDLKAESKLLRKAEEDLTLAAGCAPVDASTAATLDGTSRDAKLGCS